MRSNGWRSGWRVAVLVVTFALFALTGAAFGQNGVMMQYFHWYDSPSDNLWQKVAAEAPNLHDAGFTALWLPPAYKVSTTTAGCG
jgi:alpha-amylase